MALESWTSEACTTAADELLAAGRAACALDDRVRTFLLDLYRAAGPFFALPETGRRTAMLPWGCGYVPYGLEHSGDPEEPDEVDFFVYSPRIAHLVDGVVEPAARALLGAMVPAFDAFESIAEGIATRVAARVGGDRAAGRLGGGFRRWSLLEVHQARPVGQGQPINGEHEDGVALSLAHANAPGLEIEVDGAFGSPPGRSASSRAGRPC